MITALQHDRGETGPRVAGCTYEDGLVVELDFCEHVAGRSGPVIERLQDEHFFAQAFIDHGALTWPNGYDVCPDVLRVWSEGGSILKPSGNRSALRSSPRSQRAFGVTAPVLGEAAPAQVTSAG